MAVKKSTSRSRSRLPSGIHEVATKTKDITPVKPKEKSPAVKFAAAKKELAPFIATEARGDDQIEIVNVSAAVKGGASYTALKDIGVSRSNIDKALREQESQEQEEEPPVSLGPDIPAVTKGDLLQVGLITKPKVGVPTPTVRPAPKPGKKLTVDKEIRDTAAIVLSLIHISEPTRPY